MWKIFKIYMHKYVYRCASVCGCACGCVAAFLSLSRNFLRFIVASAACGRCKVPFLDFYGRAMLMAFQADELNKRMPN